MQIAQVLSGYSLGSADLLRRAMGKKIQSEMDAQRKTFVDGATARGVAEAKASRIFDQVAKFAGYGFNKSHAAAYALVAYQTAYLKTNYPVEFLAASMTLELSDTDKLNLFRQEAERLKIKVLGPDINRSDATFTVETVAGEAKGAIRYALAAIRNVGEAAMRTVVAERGRSGPFKDVVDFAGRVDPRSLNKRTLENLVRAGAFDALEPNRARLYGGTEALIRLASSAAEERQSNQINLFGGGPAAAPAVTLPAVPDWPLHDRLRHELEAIGFYLSAHPLDAYAKGLARLGVTRAIELAGRLAAGGSSRVKLAGVVIGRVDRTSGKGSRLCHLQLSDKSGMFEVTLFSEVLTAAGELIGSGKPLLITADARLDEERMRVTAQLVQPLDEAVAHAAGGLRISLSQAAAVPGLIAAIAQQRRGRGRISLVADLGEEGEVEIGLPGGYMISAAAREALYRLPGVTEVQEI